MNAQVKKPPDKYKTLKILFKKLQNDLINYTPISEAVIRTHQLTIYVYQFIRANILYRFDNLYDIPIINDSFIRIAYKVLVKKSRGPKLKGDNLQIFNDLNSYYEYEFKDLINQDKINGKNLSSIIDYSSTDIVTNINNNIKLNFIKYVKRYVNESFREVNNSLLEQVSGVEKTNKRKQLNKELYYLKEDLINGTMKCDEKYHNFTGMKIDTLFFLKNMKYHTKMIFRPVHKNIFHI